MSAARSATGGTTMYASASSDVRVLAQAVGDHDARADRPQRPQHRRALKSAARDDEAGDHGI